MREPSEFDAGFRRSLAVWGLIMGSALIAVAFKLTPPLLAWGLCALLAIEAYTIIDEYKGNTLSEAMWWLARRPLVPLLFGIALGWGLGAGVLVSPYLGVMVGLLYGHFFWQAQQE
jgi:hypothetical protein